MYMPFRWIFRLVESQQVWFLKTGRHSDVGWARARFLSAIICSEAQRFLLNWRYVYHTHPKKKAIWNYHTLNTLCMWCVIFPLGFLYVQSPEGYILLQFWKLFFFRLSWNFFSGRFGPLGLRNCNKKFVCVCLSNKIGHRPSGHSFGPICMKFDTLVYLWDT